MGDGQSLPSSIPAMALKGKGKQVASDSDEPTSATRASCSRRGDKRRRGPGDEAETSSSSVAARRPRRGAPKSVGDDTRIPVDEGEENQELRPEGDPDDDCVLVRASLEGRFSPATAVVDLEWLHGELVKLKKDGEGLIPFAPFCRQVKKIFEACSSEKIRWTPEALRLLQGEACVQEAEDYLLQVFKAVIQLDRDVMAHPIPWYGNNTRLTEEQEEAVFVLSCGTSGIPVYVRTMTGHDIIGKELVLPVEYCQRFLAPRLGSERGQIKLFFSNSLTCSEINFSTVNKYFRLYKWSRFIKSNCIKEGDTYAFTFEEDEEGGFLSLRMHALNGMLGSEEYDKERPQRLQGSHEGTLSVEQSAAVTRTASMQIPYLPFVCMALKIATSCSSGYCWSRGALLSLHEAAVQHLVSLYEEVNQFATLLTPYISDDGTKLTPQEEQAAFSLSCDCASSIRTYVWTMKGSYQNLVFATIFSKQYLSPYLGLGKWKAKVFAGNSLTPVEVCFQMTKEQKVEKRKAAIYGGWRRFVEINGFKKGDVCACTFEEEEDKKDGPLSLRVHLLREAPK